MNIVIWTLQIILAGVFFVSANLKLGSFAEASGRFAELGYPAWVLYAVAAVELFGAIGLLIPKTSQGAAGILMLLMTGAIYSEFASSHSLGLAFPAIVLLMLLGLIVVLKRNYARAIYL